MALAALSAVGVFDVASPTAEAATTVSPFAGRYVGADPQRLNSSWAVTVSDGGRIASSYSSTGSRAKGSISGRVGADGSYAFTVSVTGSFDDERRGTVWYSYSYKSTGNLASDAAGNIVGAADTGESFSWLRQ